MKNKLDFASPFLMITGIAMMIYGVARGEVGVVFMKAVHICLECIGIG